MSTVIAEGIGAIVGKIFQPIADVIEHLTVSGDAKIALQQKMLEGQMAAAGSLMAYQSQLLAVQSDAIKAEATGNSWLQRSWRPITMLTFLALVVFDSFGWLHSPLAPQAWTLLQIGLGGYVAGRSVEKIAGPVVQALVAKK
jgi:Holin of 3TMs, for gene-transfer release